MIHEPAFVDEARTLARERSAASPTALSTQAKQRLVLLQTQAEGAGAQEVSRILGQGLSREGFEVHFVFLFRRTNVFDDLPNTTFCARERPNGIFSVARMLAVLLSRLRDIKPDVVVCFQHYGNIIGAIAARLAGARVVIANRTSAKSLMPWWLRGIDLGFGLAGLFRAIVVNSKPIEDEYEAYPRQYRAKIVRIDHGFEIKATELSRVEARRLFDLAPDATVLGCAARLHATKNLQAAMRLLVGRDWHLAIAGQGPAMGDLTALATSLGVAERVHFVGELPPNRIGAFLRSLDVFVFPTVAETFGLAAVEAAQAGVPVVANDLHVLREVLAVDGSPCAMFVDADDPAAFAMAVQRVLKDGDLKAELSARSARLANRYSLDTMVSRYAALINSISSRSA